MDALKKIKTQAGTKHVIILVTMKEGFPEFQEVVDKAEATFGEGLLNYAIVKLFDPSEPQLTALIDEATNIKYYNSNFSKLVFLIVAPFGNKDGCKYVKCVDGGHVFVRDIVSKFTSSLVQQSKFFFFDGYLVDGSTSSRDLVTSLDVESLGLENKAAAASQLPKNGNNLIAFSPFLNVLRNDQDKVGKWSMALMKNIQEYVLPVSLLLDKTWDDISPPFVATQEPHFIHSMKPIFLKEYEAQDFEDRNALTSEKDIIKDLNVIRHLKPDQTDLETALSDLVDLGEDNPQLWRKKVGDRLAHHLKDLPYKYAKVFIHIIQNIYTHGLKVTWGVILDTLELTHDGKEYPIKVDDERGSVQVSQTVRDYMMRNYMKYYRRAEDMAAEKRSEAAHSRRTAAEQSGAEEKIELELIYGLKPDQEDLESALYDLIALGTGNPKLWRDKVGGRLAHRLKGLSYKYASVFLHIIQNIYKNKLPVTWGIVIDALELTDSGASHEIKVDVVRDGSKVTVQVSETVKDFMRKNYQKYHERL